MLCRKGWGNMHPYPPFVSRFARSFLEGKSSFPLQFQLNSTVICRLLNCICLIPLSFQAKLSLIGIYST